MHQDVIILLWGFLAFVVFLAIHFIVFRFLSPERIIMGIMVTVGSCATICLFAGNPKSISLAMIIYGLCCFNYILCIFGPFETSIRMRVLREIGQKDKKDGVRLQDILSKYNTAVILDTRLRRLVGCGDLIKKENKYYLAKKGNAFFIIDFIAQKLHAFIHSN